MYYLFSLGYYLISLGLAALLGLIPANIAKKKGHSFGLWWFYGWMLFIVAIIHVQFIEDYNSPKTAAVAGGLPVGGSAADEIKKYRDLADSGAITEEEFQEKKRQLLGDSGGNAQASYGGASRDADRPSVRGVVPETVSGTASPLPGLSQQRIPTIICNGGQYRNSRYRMGSGTVTVGRRPGCQIRYPDGTPGISGEHCSIAWDAAREEFIVRDLSSTYGTFRKDGSRLRAGQAVYLKPGEVLILGDSANSLRLALE